MNKTETAPEGVFDELARRLTAIIPEQAVAPEVDVKEGDHIVATATDHIKLLCTLRLQLAREHDVLIDKKKELTKEAIKYVDQKDLGTLLTELRNPGSRAFDDKIKLDQVCAEIRVASDLHDAVDMLLWIDIQRQHTDLLMNDCIGIRSDWSLVWREEGESERRVHVAVIDMDELLNGLMHHFSGDEPPRHTTTH